ncbi:MAG: hypothetical protein LBI99_10855 [Propionibacteriaceae bacterium]|jgi:ubiquinone biosynthesis protein UbiJ|nr:hypothetical protein [Propionibacteriaceae bacterium]
MIDWTAIVSALLSAALSGSLVGAVLNHRTSRHKPQIEREAAAVSNAEKSADMALEIAERLSGEVDKLRTQLVVLEEKLSRLTAEKSMWQRWASQVRDDWPTMRQAETPPPLPTKTDAGQ